MTAERNAPPANDDDINPHTFDITHIVLFNIPEIEMTVPFKFLLVESTLINLPILLILSKDRNTLHENIIDTWMRDLISFMYMNQNNYRSLFVTTINSTTHFQSNPVIPHVEHSPACTDCQNVSTFKNFIIHHFPNLLYEE